MTLPHFWYILIAAAWAGYFLLEGFDLGAGALLPVFGRDRIARRALVNAVGPSWDGNEIWLLLAVVIAFIAFPSWDAGMLVRQYPAIALIAGTLVLRIVFSVRTPRAASARRRRARDRTICACSVILAVGWGVVVASTVHGVVLPRGASPAGTAPATADWYEVLGGMVTLGLCMLHGAVFLGVRTAGALRERARRLSLRTAAAVAPPTVAFLIVSQHAAGSAGSDIAAAAAVAALLGTMAAVYGRREELAFAGTALTIGLIMAALAADLWPTMPVPADLTDTRLTSHVTVISAASQHGLATMNWAAVIAVPIVIVLAAQSYRVLRARLTRGDFVPGVPAPQGADVAERRGRSSPPV